MSPFDRFTCEEVFRRLDDYLDRELAPAEMQRVSEHLQTCAACAQEYAFEAGVLTDVRAKLHRIQAPSDLRQAVLRLIQNSGVDPQP